MEQILAQAKLADWMRSFSDFDLPKPSTKQTFEWMEGPIVPLWMFLEDLDTVLDVYDDQYFDEYTVHHHPQPTKFIKRFGYSRKRQP